MSHTLIVFAFHCSFHRRDVLLAECCLLSVTSCINAFYSVLSVQQWIRNTVFIQGFCRPLQVDKGNTLSLNHASCMFPLCCFQVVSAAEPRLPLELKPGLTYTIQVRCSSLDEPPLWSDWSKPHNIKLDSKNRSLSNRTE